jgi:hypothetical protein
MSDSTAVPPMASPEIKPFDKSQTTMTVKPARDFDIEEYFVPSSKISADNSLVQWILMHILHCPTS